VVGVRVGQHDRLDVLQPAAERPEGLLELPPVAAEPRIDQDPAIQEVDGKPETASGG
jgi:hypothetical protein